jgi:hypothetical protein
MQLEIETTPSSLQLLRPGTACAWCEKEARQAGVSLAYDPSRVSHGICPRHLAEVLGPVEELARARARR